MRQKMRDRHNKKQNKQLFPVVCWLRWLVGWLGDSFVCKHLVGTSSWDATHFNVSLRHFCSRSTSFPSALEVYHDHALYKFTIDIDIQSFRHHLKTFLFQRSFC